MTQEDAGRVEALAAMEMKEELVAFTYPLKELKQDEVEIAISHCGICYSDIHLLDNDWGISKYPLVPGHEIIGHIVAKGSDVTELEVGQRVGVGWQRSACLQCRDCDEGHDQLCTKKSSTCVGHFGGFAEKIQTKAAFTFPIPEGLASENAAPLLCAGATVFSPLYRHVKPGMKVGVIGIGGLGHLAIQFAHAMGCEVTAFSTSESKREEAFQLGASSFVNSKNKSELKQVRRQFDFLLSTIHANIDFSPFIQALRPFGKLCFVGATSKPIPVHVGMLLSEQREICGSIIGSRAEMQNMLAFAEKHQITAQTECFPSSDVNLAITKVRNNDIRYRAVLLFS